MNKKRLVEHLKARIKHHEESVKRVTGGNTRGKYQAIIHELEMILEKI